MAQAQPPVALARLGGCVLAGGQGRRMHGADKGLVELRGEALAALVLRQLKPQVGQLVINANRNLERYQAFGVPVISDLLGDFKGPLAGMHAALTARASDCDAVLFVPCDAPRIAPQLAQRLLHALAGQRAALACVAGRQQATFSLLRTSEAATIAASLSRGEHKLEQLFTSIGAVPVAFDDCPECFQNLNSRDQLEAYLLHDTNNEP